MPEIQVSETVSILHHATVTVIPDTKSTLGDITFDMAVDGVPAGRDTISADFSEGFLKSCRVYPEPYKTGQTFQVSLVDGGTISQCNIIAAPLSVYSTVREVGEVQMTYSGKVTIQFFFDGVQAGVDREFENTGTGFKTEKFYLPSGTRGNIFQYRQIANADATARGYIAWMSTDAMYADVEQPSQEQN